MNETPATVTRTELNEIVTRLLEVKPDDSRMNIYWQSAKGYWEAMRQWDKEVEDGPPIWAWKPAKRFTSDITAAFQLIPLFSKHFPDNDQEGHYFVLTHCWKHGWRADVIFDHDHDDDAVEFTLCAPTAELAICLAYVRMETGTLYTVTD